MERLSCQSRPAHSRRHLNVTCYTEGFSHFVTSMTAPVASGWSVSPGGTRTQAHDAIKRVAEAIVQRKTRVLDFDLRAYFDNVRHDRLLEKVAQRV